MNSLSKRIHGDRAVEIVSFRIRESVAAEIDLILDKFPRATRSKVINALLAEGLAASQQKKMEKIAM